MDSKHIPDKRLAAKLDHLHGDEPKTLLSTTPNSGAASAAESSAAQSLYLSAEHQKPLRNWKPSLWRPGPISGIFGMLLAIASLIASLGILAGSDKRPVNGWSTPPSTYLAIFTAIANLSLRYAAIQGVLVTWWIGALKGSSISNLHFNWRAGTSLYGAFIAGRRMGLIGIACIASTLVMLDGPLLQRASIAVSGTDQGQAVQVTVQMAPQLPLSYTGIWLYNTAYGEPNFRNSAAWNSSVPIPGGSTPNDVLLQSNSHVKLELSKLWYPGKNLPGVVKGCPGQCKLKLSAPALIPTTCETKHVPMSYIGNFDIFKVQNHKIAPPLDSCGFMISSSLYIEEENEQMILITGSSTTQPGANSRNDCNSTFTYTTCLLTPGEAEWDVEVQDNKIHMDTIGKPEVISFTNYTVAKTASSDGQHDSTLAGIVLMMSDRYNTMVNYMRLPGMGPSSMAQINPAVQEFQRDDGYVCQTFNDPQDAVLTSLNKLMIYAGALAGNAIVEGKNTLGRGLDSRVQRRTEAQLSGHTDAYHTDYSYFIAAALLELLCIMLIAPTYWGWWRIGRSVSFSPLEMAKAFESPLFADSNSNASGRELARSMEGVIVQYGGVAAIGDDHATLKMAYGNKLQEVTRPQIGQAFGV